MPTVSIKATMRLVQGSFAYPSILIISMTISTLLRQLELLQENKHWLPREGQNILSSQLFDGNDRSINREFDQQVVAFGLKVRAELEKINKEKEKVEAEKAAVQQNEADNWLEKSRIRTDRSELENETAIIKRDHELLEKRQLQIQLQEDQRRRNRFVL